MDQPVAIFFQARPAPDVDGQKKPFKRGGYSDSGADIAYTLRKIGASVVTPVDSPDAHANLDWVFPDDETGMQAAYARGARTFWANTVLYRGHPFDRTTFSDVCIVGQEPSLFEKIDDKFKTHELLRKSGLSAARAVLAHIRDNDAPIEFPFVLKPVRGRGSQGVKLIRTQNELDEERARWAAHHLYGDRYIAEEFLSGTEVTFTVMPPGIYEFFGTKTPKPTHWALPAVRRFNHLDGIAPYNGVVAVTQNSAPVRGTDARDPALIAAMRECEAAARLVASRAPIRIDCRRDAEGPYRLFDLNMKPNMTGAGRPGRDDQDSLVAIAAREVSWSYGQLLLNTLRQAWKKHGNVVEKCESVF